MTQHPPPPDSPDCREPFTPCWCESRPNNPHCKDVNSVPIDNLLLLILIAFILAFNYKSRKVKNI